MAVTSSIVDMTISDNATWQDAFQIGTVGDTTWSFTGMSFKCEVKASRDDTTPLITVLSSAGQIVVDDPVARVLHFNVPYTTFQPLLPPATYVYDFMMIDGSVPPIRTLLMQGQVIVVRGVVED